MDMMSPWKKGESEVINTELFPKPSNRIWAHSMDGKLFECGHLHGEKAQVWRIFKCN